MTAQETLMILCAEDCSCSNLTLTSEEEDNVDKLSQNSSVNSDVSDENDNNFSTPVQKFGHHQHDHSRVQVLVCINSVSTPQQPTYFPAVQHESGIAVQCDTTPSQSGMYDHDNIQLLTNPGPLSSPEHVISIPLDIEDNDTSPEINITRNFEQQILFQNNSSDNEDRNDYYIIDTPSPP